MSVEILRLQQIADSMSFEEAGSQEERAQHYAQVMAEMEPYRRQANAVELETRNAPK